MGSMLSHPACVTADLEPVPPAAADDADSTVTSLSYPLSSGVGSEGFSGGCSRSVSSGVATLAAFCRAASNGGDETAHPSAARELLVMPNGAEPSGIGTICEEWLMSGRT